MARKTGSISPRTQLGRYEVRRFIGSGGMGEVYLAWDTQLDRNVALKILPANLASNHHRMQRFIQEAKAASALSHPNIAYVYEIGKSGDISFIALEYVEGENLEARIRRGPLDFYEIVSVGIQIADALDEAHAKGITHRDIKPSNIVISTRGQAKILDFGLAKVISHASEASSLNHVVTEIKTNPGSVMGTVQYMSPEQALGRDLDQRTDIFSIGVVFYEMATGRLPFAGPNNNEIVDRILHSEPERITDSNRHIPPELERVITKCLEKDPDRRYQTARDLEIELKNVRDDAGKGNFRPAQRKQTSVDKISSLAVLPLVTTESAEDLDYLADGITETIINNLSGLSGLRVVARATAFRYKGSEVEPTQMKERLGVGAILTGRIRHVASRFVVTTELVDTTDGSQLWGARYPSSLSDIFEVQEQIAKEVVDNLKVELSGDDRRRLRKRQPENAVAYELYLKGRYYWNKRTTENVTKAIDYFRKAIDADPSYALAYAGLADCYNLLGSYGAVPPTKTVPRAKAAAKKALEIDPDLAEAHATLGFAALTYDWDWSGAELEFKRAIQLNPNYGTAYQWYSSLFRALRQFENAIAQAKKTLEVDPLSLIANTNLALQLYYARRYDESIEQFKQSRELDDTFPPAFAIGLPYEQKAMYDEAIAAFQKAAVLSGNEAGIVGCLGHAYAVAGRTREAVEVLNTLEQLSRERYISSYDRAVICCGLGDIDQAFAYLTMAYEEKNQDLGVAHVDPRLDRLHSDVRFTELLAKIGLEPGIPPV